MTPLLKCLNNQQVDYVMGELHEGIFGLHTRGRSLEKKVVHDGYYWPTLKVGALNLTRRYLRCQKFHEHHPTTSITLVPLGLLPCRGWTY